MLVRQIQLVQAVFVLTLFVINTLCQLGNVMEGVMEERRQGNVEMASAMATMAQKIIQIHDDIIALNAKVAIQNGRVFKLEKWQAFILGGTALLGILGSIVTVAVMWFHTEGGL